MRELTRFQRDLLRAAAVCGPSSGQTIKRQVMDWYDREITHGQLYPNIDTLVQAGLLSKGQIDRRTNEYRLTTAGFTYVDRLAGRWQDAADAARDRRKVTAGGG